MTTYRVQRMTTSDYNDYMSGGYNYSVENLDITANNPEEAVKMAKKRGYVVNDYVRTLEEIEAERKAREEARKTEEAKRERAKAKRAENEARKAAEAGMTVEEYRKEKNRQATIRRIKKEIAEMEGEIERKKAVLRKLEG